MGLEHCDKLTRDLESHRAINVLNDPLRRLTFLQTHVQDNENFVSVQSLWKFSTVLVASSVEVIIDINN